MLRDHLPFLKRTISNHTELPKLKDMLKLLNRLLMTQEETMQIMTIIQNKNLW